MPTQISRNSPQVRVYIDGTLIKSITMDSYANFIGGSRANQAAFIHTPLRNMPSVVDEMPGPKKSTTPWRRWLGKRVNISVADIGGRHHFVHFGRIMEAELSQSQSGDSILLRSMMTDDLFGYPMGDREVAVYDFYNHGLSDNDRGGVVFNPTMGGEVYGNYYLSKKQTPQMVRESDLISGEPSHFWKWTLPDAVFWLMKTLNPDRQQRVQIRNTTLGVLKKILPKVIVSTTEIPAGTYLPEALDKLLSPYGFGWKVTHLTRNARRIDVFTMRPGWNGSDAINSPVVGETDWPIGIPVSGMNVRFSAANNCVGKVTVLGSNLIGQLTLGMIPDWDRKLDDTPLDDLALDSAAMIANPELRKVYRKFKVDPTDFGVLTKNKKKPWKGIVNDQFGSGKMLEMLPTLTTGADGKPVGNIRGVHLEYKKAKWLEWDKAEWVSVTETSGRPGLNTAYEIDIVEGEMAIWFGGQWPPVEFMHADIYTKQEKATDGTVVINEEFANKMKIGLRATFSFDTGLQSRWSVGSIDNQSRTHMEYVIELPDRFKWYQSLNEQWFDPRRPGLADDVFEDYLFVADPKNTKKEDPHPEMKKLAEQILSSFGDLDVSGDVTLMGCDLAPIFQPSIGRGIVYVKGLQFFDLSASGNRAQTGYPVVAGMAVSFPAQTTTITIGSFREAQF